MKKFFLTFSLLICFTVNLASATNYKNKFEYDAGPDSIVITKLTAIDEIYTFPSINGNKILKFANKAGQYNKKVKQLKFASNTSHIGNNAFEGCSSLSSITFSGSKLLEIGNYAFYDCTKLSALKLPSSVKLIGECAFENCSALTSADIGGNELEIGKYAFKGCKSLESLTLNNGIARIGDSAFYQNRALSSLKVGNTLKSIDKLAFSGCTALFAAQLPPGMEYIGENAFEGCTSLTEIYLSGEIREAAFRNCSELTTVYLQEGTTTVSANAFAGCSKIKNIIMGSSVSYIDDSAFSVGTDTVIYGNRNTYAEEFAKSKNLRFVDLIGMKEEFAEKVEASVSQTVPIKIIIDDKRLSSSAKPVMINDRVLVPLRAIFEALGAVVDWNEELQAIYASKDKTNLRLTIGDKIMYKGSQIVELEVEPQLINDSTYVPVRAVAEGFDCSVYWEDKTETVRIITTEDYISQYTYLEAFPTAPDLGSKINLNNIIQNSGVYLYAKVSDYAKTASSIAGHLKNTGFDSVAVKDKIFDGNEEKTYCYYNGDVYIAFEMTPIGLLILVF